MDVLITKAVETLVLPPGFNVAIGLLGLVVLHRWKRLGVSFIVISLLSLYVFSLPRIAQALVNSLESYPALSRPDFLFSGAEAIVVLGGGIYPRAPEYGFDVLSAGALPRLRYGAYLHRLSGLPIVVTGGRVYGVGISEGELMQQFLEQELGATVAHVETSSLNTAENARYSRQILEPLGIDQVIIVTHASHMARAVASFEREGFGVVPGPIEFIGPRLAYPGALGWFPNLSVLGYTTSALREYVGRIWYVLRY